MTKVLFICHGNICRSPMAEFIFKKIVKEKGLENDFFIDSAATSREEIGNDIYPLAKEMLKRHDVPFERRASKQITKQDLSGFDYIVAMEWYNIRNLNRLLGESEKYMLLAEKDISDPWYSGDFETAYKEIEEGCKTLFFNLRNRNNL